MHFDPFLSELMKSHNFVPFFPSTWYFFFALFYPTLRASNFSCVSPLPRQKGENLNFR